MYYSHKSRVLILSPFFLQSVPPSLFSLFLPFSSLYFSLKLLSPYIFFSKRLFAALTTKLSANEDVSTSVKLGIRLILPVENVLLLSSISLAGKRWNQPPAQSDLGANWAKGAWWQNWGAQHFSCAALQRSVGNFSVERTVFRNN